MAVNQHQRINDMIEHMKWREKKKHEKDKRKKHEKKREKYTLINIDKLKVK